MSGVRDGASHARCRRPARRAFTTDATCRATRGPPKLPKDSEGSRSPAQTERILDARTRVHLRLNALALPRGPRALRAPLAKYGGADSRGQEFQARPRARSRRAPTRLRRARTQRRVRVSERGRVFAQTRPRKFNRAGAAQPRAP